MRDVSFIADVAVLPRWIKVWQVLDYVAGVHPRFDRAKAESFLSKTTIGHTRKVRDLSKGMVAQLHLALVMAIDARLLVLDEPTLGLDILYRKQFYDSLLNDYFDRSRTIIVTTHQVEEIQNVITDLVYINRGRIVLSCSMEEIESRFLEVMVHPGHIEAARALKPMHERQVLGRSILMFDGVDRERVAALGDARTPSIADLFVAVIECTRSGPVSTQSNVMPESSLRSQGIAAAAIPAARLMYWSVRRELWENRAIYVAPVAIACVFLFGFSISMIHLLVQMHATPGLDPMQQRHLSGQPYEFAEDLIMAAALIVGMFYSVDALYGERRDRSILFWKSLPVSDLTTVLSKAAIPIVILPLLAFAITVLTQWIMLMISSAVLAGNGLSVSTLWSRVGISHRWPMLLFHFLCIHGLWQSPIYAWLLLISAWARRAPILWAALPPLDHRHCGEGCLQHHLLRFVDRQPLHRRPGRHRDHGTRAGQWIPPCTLDRSISSSVRVYGLASRSPRPVSLQLFACAAIADPSDSYTGFIPSRRLDSVPRRTYGIPRLSELLRTD